VWQLADELRREVVALTARPPACHDRRFCDQLRDASDSSCSNTAEGFGRYNPAEFQRFLVLAKSSLLEVQDRLDGARHRTYLSEEAFARLHRLADRAIGANVRLQQYLRRVSAGRGRRR
jgi:four helix bundle protein